MSTDESWRKTFRPDIPSPARMYSYFLGGKDHYPADREAAEQVIALSPEVRLFARHNRAFLRRVVRYLVTECGIGQFLDIGTGLPTSDNVHEVAQSVEPSARVVYADNDPLVLTHARALLANSPQGRTAYVQADLRDPESILGSPRLRDVLDLSKPVALMLVGVLHFIPDEDRPAEILATLIGALPAGSYLVASHTTTEYDPEGWARIQRQYAGGGIPGQVRDSGDFARLAFSGLDLVPPGVVLVSEWRPDKPGPHPVPAEVSVCGGVARKQ
jgi:SAM-dependent methyltransferase